MKKIEYIILLIFLCLIGSRVLNAQEKQFEQKRIRKTHTADGAEISYKPWSENSYSNYAISKTSTFSYSISGHPIESGGSNLGVLSCNIPAHAIGFDYNSAETIDRFTITTGGTIEVLYSVFEGVDINEIQHKSLKNEKTGKLYTGDFRVINNNGNETTAIRSFYLEAGTYLLTTWVTYHQNVYCNISITMLCYDDNQEGYIRNHDHNIINCGQSSITDYRDYDGCCTTFEGLVSNKFKITQPANVKVKYYVTDGVGDNTNIKHLSMVDENGKEMNTEIIEYPSVDVIERTFYGLSPGTYLLRDMFEIPLFVYIVIEINCNIEIRNLGNPLDGDIHDFCGGSNTTIFIRDFMLENNSELDFACACSESDNFPDNMFLMDENGNQFYSYNKFYDGYYKKIKYLLPAGKYRYARKSSYDEYEFELHVFPIESAQLSSSHNYIRTKTYMAPDTILYLDQIQYFDGLGRPIQTVQRAITPQKKDLVSIQTYDAFGRDAESWLPGLSDGNGAYADPTAIMNSAKSTAMHNDQKPYSKPVYESSPLNRVMAQYGPGQDWHKTYGSDSKAVRIGYLNNSATVDSLKCIQYKVNGVNTTTTLSKTGVYPAGELYVTRMTDEDGNRSYEFKDKLGQVLLTRQINSNLLYDTYYVYDDAGNLCYVLPPLAANTTEYTDNCATLRLYAYLYKYDNRNRCIRKRLPGTAATTAANEGWLFYVYDKADRLIFSQDGEQRTGGEWSFSIPDVFGRIVLTGICKTANSTAIATGRFDNNLIKADPFTATGTYKGYNLKLDAATLTLGTVKILSASYYDTYTFLGTNGIPNNANTQYNPQSGYGVQYTASSKGLLTGTLTALFRENNTDIPEFLYSVMYYDIKGQVIQTKSNNHLTGGIEKEYLSYNFTGQPTGRMHVHSATGQDTRTEYYTYTYDHAGRLMKTTHQLQEGNNAAGPVIVLAENTYDELGRLKTNKKNKQANLTTTYGYNIRSWTKSISSPLFNEILYYNDQYAGSQKRYNGNVGAMTWQVKDQATNAWDKLRGYTFTYDNLSQLTAANYLENGTASNSYKTAYTYDKHGNMTKLTRYGKTTASAYGIIDNVTMVYTGNQLTKATDAVATISLAESADFKDYANAATEYTYNKNGAMTKDMNKGITAIQYNSLNLPRQVHVSSPTTQGWNKYTYTASGVKLRVESQSSPVTQSMPMALTLDNSYSTIVNKITDYVGNIIYEDNALKMIVVDGGYIENNQYHFYLTDHLGNNRVVANASGTPVQKNHYYPFGMAFAETPATEQGKQPYKFGGKELDQMHGLNHYDFSARYNDGVRFTTIDPHAENYFSWSPYVYVGNNPIIRTDPTGMDWFVDGETGNVIFIRGISDLSTLNDEQLEMYRLGNINRYENLGADNMFGDVVSWDGVDNILDHTIFNFEGADASTSFMKRQGYEKAERLHIRESLEHGYGIEDALRIPSRETLSRQITYVTPDKYGRYNEMNEGVRTEYSLYPPAWNSGAQGSYTLIQPYGSSPSGFNQMLKSTPQHIIEIPGEIKNYYKEKIDKTVKENINLPLKYRHLFPMF